MSDPYLDPESEILRKEFALTDQERVHRVEANAVFARVQFCFSFTCRVGAGHSEYPMCRTYRVEKHMRRNLVATIACEQHFSREAVFPWTETLDCVALETAI